MRTCTQCENHLEQDESRECQECGESVCDRCGSWDDLCLKCSIEYTHKALDTSLGREPTDNDKRRAIWRIDDALEPRGIARTERAWELLDTLLRALDITAQHGPNVVQDARDAARELLREHKRIQDIANKEH